jgi:hypothetical protein
MHVLPFWAAKLICGICLFSVLIVISVKFRAQDSLAAAYGDDEEAYRVDERLGEFVTWTPEMVLPHVPQLRRKKKALRDDCS